MPTRLQSGRKALFAKLRLVLILLGFAGLFVLVAHLIAFHMLALAKQRGLALDLVDIYLFGFAYGLLFFVLTSLPLVLVLAYQGVQSDVVAVKTVDDLALCGIDAASIALRWRDFSDRNSLAAFALPMLLNLLFLYLAWVLTLFPHGLDGALDYLDSSRSRALARSRPSRPTLADRGLVNGLGRNLWLGRECDRPDHA